MGLFKDLYKSVTSAIVEPFKRSVSMQILNATQQSYDALFTNNISEVGFHRNLNSIRGMVDTSNSVNTKSSQADWDVTTPKSKTLENIATVIDEDTHHVKPGFVPFTLYGSIQVPNWGYDTFINERSTFQKGLAGPASDPGYFYFKIFFNFNTQYGLIGGVLNNNDAYEGVNTALKYLLMCSDNYKIEKLKDRANALVKFIRILSYINSVTPWFFKEISGLDKANIPVLNEFSKQRSIEIGVLPDAIDMRLSTIMDLYKYAAFDEYSGKEILPENLRKFDMSVMVFAAPIKYLHTALDRSLGFKKISNNVNKYEEMPSFKLFTFHNCEFDMESLGNMLPGTMNNETPFSLGNNRIKINYDKVYTHTMNEFNRMLFGTTGVYYNYYELFSDGSSSLIDMTNNDLLEKFGINQLFGENGMQGRRYDKIAQMYEQNINTHFKYSDRQYKKLIDASEAVTHNNLIRLTGQNLGNIYGYDRVIGSQYYWTKMKYNLGKSNNMRYSPANTIPQDQLLEWFGITNRNIYDKYFHNNDMTWLSGYAETSVGSAYWKEKINKLKARQQKRHIDNNIGNAYMNNRMNRDNRLTGGEQTNIFRNTLLKSNNNITKKEAST